MKMASQIIVLLCTSTLLVSFAQADIIEVDGEIEETAWQEGIQFKDFKVSEPLSLAIPPNKTQVIVTSDSKGIYVGFINFQQAGESPDSRSLRDAQINTDFNQVIVDFDGQGIRAFGFKVSRTGAAQDSIWSDENRESTDWNGSWQYAVQQDDEYWSSEIFIPWTIASMSATDKDKRKLKLYFSRWHQGKSMQFSFPAIDDDQTFFMSRFVEAELAFSETVSLDWFPYISYNNDIESSKEDFRVGLDVFWRPTSAQQINLTFNPDFGQLKLTTWWLTSLQWKHSFPKNVPFSGRIMSYLICKDPKI